MPTVPMERSAAAGSMIWWPLAPKLNMPPDAVGSTSSADS
jgi:hypothetical protein